MSLLPFIALALNRTPRVMIFRVDGIDRSALVYPGVGPEPHAGRPIVFGFHGHGGNMNSADRSFDIEDRWPAAMVVYPQGLHTTGKTDPEGLKNGWQQRPWQDNDRDVKFFDTMMRSLRGYNPTKVFAMGHSNGGAMTYVLWSERGGQIAGFGISCSPPTVLPRTLNPAPAFFSAGRTDPIVSFRAEELAMRGVARLDQIDLATAKKTGLLTLAVGRTGIQMGTYIHPDGHRFPPEAAKATVEFFKRLAD